IPNSITIPTECKTCPYNLCPNTKVYDWENSGMNLTCWSAGSDIAGDTTWLKTTDNCYVTQYDIEEYADTEDLPYCGYIEPEWTHASARTKYYSECYYEPYIEGVPIKNYKYNINLDLTCAPRIGTDNSVLRDRKWYKTNSNCYVHETTLDRVRDESDLDDCGPLYLNAHPTDHLPEPTSTTEPAFPPPTSTLNRRFLYTTTIGEEYVNCTTSSVASDRAHGIRRVYEFNQTVTPQCGTMSEGSI
ncbi:hypothetical protein K458DRAFT_267526, partial [Lentithecium fluviatile CBS 122367]